MADSTEASDFEVKSETMKGSELADAVVVADMAPVNTSPEGR